MNCKVYTFVEQSLFKFFREQPLAAGGSQRAVLNLIAGGFYDAGFERNRVTEYRGQTTAHFLCLSESKCAAPRSNANLPCVRLFFHGCVGTVTVADRCLILVRIESPH